MADEKRLSLKVFVDNEKKRVVFAEASSDFVDILFSFLTLPLGTIIKLLSKNSGLGSIDNLYDSIERLGVQHLQTEACRNMLLSPRSAAAIHCEDLKLNIDGDLKPRDFYFCKKDDCISRSTCYYSTVRDTRCSYCGQYMNKSWLRPKNKTTKNYGVFVKRNCAKYMITDDFHVTPSSVLQYYDLLKDLGVKDIDLLEERILEFGREELLNLLKESLVGQKALTKICFPDLCIRCTTPICNNGMEMKRFISEGNTKIGQKKIQIKLIMNRTNNNVVCAEAGEEFADQLFSFLTFPLGSVLELIGCSNSLGCITNLYKSVRDLKLDCFSSEKAKSMLISPQLAPFFGCSKQMLNIKELSPPVGKTKTGCLKCYLDDKTTPSTIKCKHGVQQSDVIGLNPKLAKTDAGGVYVGEAEKFLVTDNLLVTPMSLVSVTQILKQQGIQVDHLAKRKVTIGSAQVLALLEAMLISKTGLTDALSLCQVGEVE